VVVGVRNHNGVGALLALRGAHLVEAELVGHVEARVLVPDLCAGVVEAHLCEGQVRHEVGRVCHSVVVALKGHYVVSECLVAGPGGAERVEVSLVLGLEHLGDIDGCEGRESRSQRVACVEDTGLRMRLHEGLHGCVHLAAHVQIPGVETLVDLCAGDLLVGCHEVVHVRDPVFNV